MYRRSPSSRGLVCRTLLPRPGAYGRADNRLNTLNILSLSILFFQLCCVIIQITIAISIPNLKWFRIGYRNWQFNLWLGFFTLSFIPKFNEIQPKSWGRTISLVKAADIYVYIWKVADLSSVENRHQGLFVLKDDRLPILFKVCRWPKSLCIYWWIIYQILGKQMFWLEIEYINTTRLQKDRIS